MDFSQSNFVKQAEELNQEKQQTELYRQKYQVDAPIEVYSMFENIVAGSENPEEEIFRLGTAYTFSENLGIDIGEAYTNLDSYSEAVYGKPVESHKGFFPNLRDSFYIGRVNRDIASLGNKIRMSELAGNTDMLEDLYKELETYENEINVRRQGTAQEGITNAFNQVAESLPYMLDAIAVGALGNIVAPGLGTLATGLLGTDYYSGQVYLDLRKQGASVEGANKASLLSGGTQALIELALGNVAEAIGDLPGAKTLTKDLSKKVTQNLLKSPAMKKVLSNVARYGGNAVEEGLEEVLQETVSLFTEYTMAELEGYDIDQKQVANILWENFKGGLTGSLILGGLPFGVNTAATFTDYSKIRDLAIEVESEKAFENTVKDSVVFDGMEETEKKETIKNIWDTYQSQRDEVFNQKVKEQAEITDKASGYDTEIDAEYREDGRLFTEDRQLEDGKNTFVVGNPEKEGSNLYGHIDYSIDGDTITIENFKMNETREALRNEVFQEFAEQHPGMEIKWETVGKVATDIKNELIANNPYGKENGLNYYKDTQSVTDAQTRRKIADEIGKHFKFDNKQKSAAVFVLEAMANSQGRNLTEYVQNTFGENIIGDNAEIEAMANRQNQTFQGKAGATTFSKYMKAVIYAGEKADFSTWVHELSHVYQRQLSGDLLTQAEKAFNVQNGDWSTSSYTFKNSKGQNVTYSSEEAFAYGFQDWLQTGKAPNQELKNIFEQFAEFLARCYNALKNHLNLSKDVVDVYNQLLKGDNSMLALAERAVIENDKKRLADERVKQEEAKLEQENKLKEEKAEVQAQKEENLEVTDYEELEAVEETEDTQLREDISEEEKAVFLTGTEEAKKVYETLDDTAETKEVKDNTVINTAIEQKQEMDLLFQMVGEESIKRMAESTYKRELLSNLEKAKNFYNGIYKNLDPKIRALRLKIQTGWEYDSKAGKWKYETDDSIAQFNWEGRFAEVFKLAPKNLVETLNARNITIGDMIVHEELFNIFPWLKMANVKFTNRLDILVTSLTDEGILINLAHVKDADIKKTLGHQMQHLIQGVEHSNSGFTGNNFKKLYSTLNKAVNDTVTEEEINDIDQLSKDYFNNEGEIEARRVAERYTMISNERNSNPINFQVIGSEGAAQLDLTEEVTTRMDNLNIAMHMEANGSTPKEIRLATSWERGADGQWKYEIDDAYNVDFEYKAIEFVKNNPRFTELENKLTEEGYNWDNLTKEEQKEFDELTDEFNKGYYTNETTLKEIIDAQELFKAYPQLKNMKVIFAYKPGEKRGTYRNGKIVDEFFEIEETFNDIVIYTLPNSENKEYIKTILIHEIQHAIQDIEGFAKGGNIENFSPIKASKLEQALASYAGFTKEEISKITEETEKQFYRDEAQFTEEEINDLFPDINGLGNIAQIIERDVKSGRIDALYEEMQEASKKVQKEGLVDLSSYKIKSLLTKANALFDNQSKEWQSLVRQYNEASINKDYEKTSQLSDEIEKIDPNDVLFDYEMLMNEARELKEGTKDFYRTPRDAYKSLAGEVEARNVQERYRRFKANQQARQETLLSETQDVPRDEQIILFQEEQDVRNQYENTDKWLKAPNGNDTNLTEKQWLQVRTPSFKKWFGDWENDPENASKVVDENGEPLVVYHGSNHWFNIFNEGKTNKTNVNTPENTIFTNDNKEIASSFHNYYGGAISDVILDKDSPLHRKYDWGTYRAGGVYSLFMNLRNPKILDYKGQNWNVEAMNINNEVAKALKEEYDGFIAKNIIDVGFTDVTPPISNDYIAFNNTDVKSATDNSGEFNADNPSILFQNEQSLYGVHNLSKEALEHAFKMGGLPNPSLAVTDKDLGFSSFGEISLIPYSLMLEKGNGNAGTFGADIYSPRYPSITRIVTDTGRNKVKSLFWAIENEELKREAISKTISSIEDRTRNIDLYRGLQLAYLEEKGIKDYYVYEKSNYSDEIKEKIKNLKTDDANDLDTRKVVTDIIIAEKTNAYKQTAKNLAIKELEKEKGHKENISKEELQERETEIFNELIDFYKTEKLDKDGLLSFRTVDDFIYDVKKEIRDAGKIDTYYTYQKATDYIKENNLTKDFEKWAKEQLDKVEIEEKIFNGYTPSGNIRYLEHTLENVSKWMKKQGLQGGEGFGYGLGSVRAQFTPKFHSLSEIKAEKGRLRNAADFEEIKEEYNNRFNEIIERLSGDNSYDVGVARFEEAFTQNDPIGYLEKEYGLNINSDFADEMFNFAEDLKEMPTEYFETKYTRPVMLNEFAAAIVPSNLPQELKDKLEQEGLIVKEYTDNRQEEVNKALEEINETRDVLFQTEGELLEEARSFDSWEEWRDYVETFKNDFDYEQVPSNADDTFYRTTWELANREPQEPVNKDETFIDYILNRDNLKDFLAEIGSIDTIDIWQPMDEEEAREIEMLQNKKDIINTKLAQWKGFGRSVLYGNELKESTYKNLETQIKNKPLDFREIFTEIMNNQQFAVAEDEKTTTQLQKKYRLSDVEVNEIENSSPEKRRQIARELSNKDIAERVKNGTLEMGDELYDYIDSLNKEIGKLQEQYNSLEKEVAEDYQRISNWEDKELLRLHDQLLEAKEEYELKSDEVAKKIERGIRVTKKYKDASLRAKATYDTVFKKFNALAKSYEASIAAKEAMTRKEKITDIKKKLRQKQEEKRLSQELKKIRTQLIKRTMRKVKFDTVNYEQAKQIIAIQNLFEPNLLGGINKWIGTEGDTLRNVYSKWNTDNEYKEKMMRKLAGKYDVIDLLNETDTIEKYNSWTKEQRAMMYRALPKKDWIEELNLEELARERAETFHLDIGTRTISQWVEVDGKKELVTMDIPVLSEELEKLVKDALGETLYNQVVYRQFAEWTTDEMEQLAKRVNELYKEGRDELNNKALVRKQEAQEIRNAIERAVKDTGIVINDDDSEEVKQKKLKKIAKILGDDPTLKGTSAKKRTSKWQRLLEGYGDARLLSVARLLDNNKDGVNVSELYRKEDECYNAREKKIAERTQKINKSMADNKITLKDLYSTVTIKDWYKGESATFTIDELLFMAKAAEDEQSKQAVMFGNLFSSEKMLQEKEDLERGDMLYRYEEICYNLYEKVLAEVRKLPSKYLDFADSISADYAEQYERMNKTSIEEFNQPVNRVENYVPIVRLESNGDTNENRVIDDFMAGHGLSKKGVDKGMTKSRVKIGAFHQKPIELGLYKTWADSVQRTEHFIAYAPYVRELNRVYKNQEANLTRQFIENRYGKGMLNYIDSYIAEVANPNANVQKSQLDNLVRTLRGKTAPAYLGWKISSIIKQLITSPTPFFQFTKPIDYLKACLDCMDPKLHDAIKEKSVFMKNRKFDPIQDLIKEQEEKNTNKLEAGINKISAIGMKGLEYVDWACVAPGWLACYRTKLAEVQKEKQKIFDAEYFKTNDKKLAQEKANQISEEIAVTYADDCVRQCQPSNRKVDIAPLFKESSEVAKAYLQFQTSLNVIWNNLRYDLPYAVKNRQFAKIVGMVSGYVVAGLGVNLMCSWFDDDDADLDKIKKSIFYATTQFTDAVPVLGSSLTKLSEKLITGESGYSMGTDLTPMVTKFMQGIQAIPKARESGDWEDWQKVCGKFGEAIGLTLGLPVSGTKEILEVIEEQSITPLIGR